jgi:gluconolactonase
MTIEVVADGLGFTEGPACLPDGRIAGVTSISHGCGYIIDPTGGPMDRVDIGGGPNGLAVAMERSTSRRTAAFMALQGKPSRAYR